MLIAGGLTLAAEWLGPLPRLAPQSFYAHMIMHMGVVAVAAPLLALGVVGGRYNPVARAPMWFAPSPASLAELIVVWAWHTPVLHREARHCVAGLAVEQGLFLLTGLWLWVSALGEQTQDDRGRSAAGIVGLLLTAMHMTLLGALLGLSPRPLYPHAEGNHGLSALEDQHLGGVVMLLVGGFSYLVGGLGLTAKLLRTPTIASRGQR
jgi:putative membrane protein